MKHTASHDLPISSGYRSSTISGDGSNTRIEVYCGRCRDHYDVDMYWATCFLRRTRAELARELDRGMISRQFGDEVIAMHEGFLRDAGLLAEPAPDQA